MKHGQSLENRIHFIDEIRGFAVLCMIIYHGFYLFGTFFENEAAIKLFEFFMPVQPLFAGVFIFICGMSCTFSKNNIKRGLILLGIALGMTLVTTLIMPAVGFTGCEIYFGILHFLAVSVLLYSLLSKPLFGIMPFAGIIVCAILYAFTSGIEKGTLSYGELFLFTLPPSLYETNILMPLGIHTKDFTAADYFPLFPQIFIFFSGVFSGIYLSQKGYPDWSRKKRISSLSFLGRNALLIYVVHMPVIYALGYAIYVII